MSDQTNISWADATWNPIVGCSLVSPGCTNCYAMRDAHRIVASGVTHYQGLVEKRHGKAVWTGKVALAPEAVLTKPLRWRRPRRIFVNSMGDLFKESVPDAWIDRVFAVMALAPQHQFQLLTKRSKRMREYMTNAGAYDRILRAAEPFRAANGALCRIPISNPMDAAFWPHLWLGVSAEDQARADERVPDLLATPAAVRFISAEPLLGALRLHEIRSEGRTIDALRGETWVPQAEGVRYDLRRWPHAPRLDWVIVGGESGPGARPMQPDWARDLRDQCAAAGVPYFFKQFGEYGPNGLIDDDGRKIPGSEWLDRLGKKLAGRRLDGVEHNAFPEPRA